MSNIDEATKGYAAKWSALLDTIGKAQAELKDLKQEVKDEGYNVKVLAQIVKEQRKGAKHQEAQLTLELELTTYREAVGLPTTLEDAQQRVREEARRTHADDGEADAFGEDDTVQFGDGPEIPARDFARAAKRKSRFDA